MNDGVHAGLGMADVTVTWALQASPVPEPAAPALLTMGLLGIDWRPWRALGEMRPVGGRYRQTHAGHRGAVPGTAQHDPLTPPTH
jgi:hypothetical protein